MLDKLKKAFKTDNVCVSKATDDKCEKYIPFSDDFLDTWNVKDRKLEELGSVSMMSDVYVDIRVKIPSKELIDPHCSHDLENALFIGKNICSDIKESMSHVNVLDVDVVNVGKLNPLTFELSEDNLADD